MNTIKTVLTNTFMLAVVIVIIFTGCKKNDATNTGQTTQQNGNNNKVPVITLPDTTMFAGVTIADSNKIAIYALSATNGSVITRYTYPRDAQSTWFMPFAGNGFLYDVESDKINAINMNTGVIQWTDSVKNNSTTILHNDVFYGVSNANTTSAYVYAIDATKQSNNLLWKYQLNTTTYYPAYLNYYNGAIYLSNASNNSTSGNLLVLDAKAGTLKWSSNKSCTLSSLTNGLIISGSAFLDPATGNQIGQVPASALVPNSYQIIPSVVYANNSMFFTTLNMSPSYSMESLEINAYDRATGASKWSINGGSNYQSLSVDSIKTILQAWNNQPFIQIVNGTTPTAHSGLVSSISYGVLDSNTGQLKWSILIGSDYQNQFIIVNNTLYAYVTMSALNGYSYVPSGGGAVAVDMYSGKQKWVYQTTLGNSFNICVFAAGKGYSPYIQ